MANSSPSRQHPITTKYRRTGTTERPLLASIMRRLSISSTNVVSVQEIRKAPCSKIRQLPALLPSEARCSLDPVEALQRQNGVRQLVGAAVEHWPRQGQKLLLHRLRIRDRRRLAGRVGMKPF